MKYYYHWRYAYAVFSSSTRHYTLAALIKSTNLKNARESLDRKVRRYLQRHPEAKEHHRTIPREVLPKSWARNGGLEDLRKKVEEFSLDED